ncbi:MAG: primosomal protein N' [Deltaproteobacteria bacterium]|nr:primosomal protein N' [Deltaproteobacteria bacterium]
MLQPLFAPEGDSVARVALPVPVDELFDYSIPPTLVDAVQPGCRVQVPFRDRRLVGIVVSLARDSKFAGRLHAIESAIDPEPVLSPEMMSILRDTAHDVLCPIGIALNSALPAGSAPRITKGFAITPRGREALRSGALRERDQPVLAALSDGPKSLVALRRLAGTGVTEALRELSNDGLAATAGIEQRPSARAATVRTARVADGIDVEAAAAGPLARAPAQAALLKRLAVAAETPTAELEQEFKNAGATLRALAGRGLVAIEQRAAPRNVLGTALEPPRSVTLSSDQAAALKPIVEAVRARRGQSFLLHGVTGSGKTEIYLRAVAEALAMGRQALVLVPEITLTHQILARLRGRFGDDMAVLHSGLRPGERLEQWQRLRVGSTPIAVGARSALFAPLENLGVIVVDEEHDGAYKNEEGFRYHARSLATRRAEAACCPLILGSATPSLEMRAAADRGEIERLVLAHRIGNRPLPAVEIVDLARERERAPRGRQIVLTRPLQKAIGGHAWRCESCDITLVYHASDRRLRCHYCDYNIAPPERCGQCGAEDAALLGIGTQRLEEEVRSLFPGARIERLDRDTAQRRGFTEGVLRRIRSNDLDIVIGTQMIAKGHDFPGVRLVGVVLADIGLHLPDFRAAERTFQLLTQVAGRAGRDRAPGRVLIQCFDPDHYAIRPVKTHDYETFYAEELRHRAALGYPPFGKLVHAGISAEVEAAASAGADALADAVRAEPAGIELLGPAPSPLARLRGRYRYQLLVKSPNPAPLRRAAEALVAAAATLPSGVSATVDSNPMNML